MISLQRAP